MPFSTYIVLEKWHIYIYFAERHCPVGSVIRSNCTCTIVRSLLFNKLDNKDRHKSPATQWIVLWILSSEAWWNTQTVSTFRMNSGHLIQHLSIYEFFKFIAEFISVICYMHIAHNMNLLSTSYWAEARRLFHYIY
jgi:hypothetical protein